MKTELHAHPVLNCHQSKQLESSLLPDQAAEWSAMKQAGQGIARLIIQDYEELRPVPQYLRILALIGKGNNAGDALITCGHLMADFPRARVDLILTTPIDELRPLAFRALQQLEGRVHTHQISEQINRDEIALILSGIAGCEGIHICLDGLVGMCYSPPLRQSFSVLIEAVNEFNGIDLRASVDLPSGKGDCPSESPSFHADFTYATGIAKKVLFEGVADSGRVRYVDLGFFDNPQVSAFDVQEAILTDAVIGPLRRLRPAAVDKRQFGHLFVVGGSAYMPGALLMAVQAAVRSGVGMVTAFAPESVASALAAQVPEAMWIPWPETSNGTHDPRAMSLLLDRIDQASAVLLGPGMGKDRNTELMTQEIVKLVELPLLLDADALRSSVMGFIVKRRAHFGRVVITPHMGEFMRISKLTEPNYKAEALLEFSDSYNVTTVLKSAHTRICDGRLVLYSTQGSPVLSRGGSGDLLSGLIGGQIAQDHDCVLTAVARGVILHGLAAQKLARAKGQVAVNTTQLLDYLPEVLRS